MILSLMTILHHSGDLPLNSNSFGFSIQIVKLYSTLLDKLCSEALKQRRKEKKEKKTQVEGKGMRE